MNPQAPLEAMDGVVLTPYERVRRAREAALRADLTPQVQAALQNLRALGVQVRLVGSYVRGPIGPGSDVDFLIEDSGTASAGEIYEAIASALRAAPFDIIDGRALGPQRRALMLESGS